MESGNRQEAHVHNFYQTLKRIVAVAVLGAVVMMGTAQHARAQAAGAAAQPEKKVKDQGEFDIYNQVLKDAAAAAWPKLLPGLDTWAQKYPDSDWKDDRLYYYLQAYNGANQPGKVLDTGAQLLSKDLKAIFKDPAYILTIYYQVTVNVSKIATPSAAELATGEKAARALLGYLPDFFTAERKPAGTTDAAWTEARTNLDKVATGTLMWLAMKPGVDALAKNDCEVAEASLTKALQQFGDGAAIAYHLGRAARCLAKTKPDRAPLAIYYFARAVAVDSTLGGTADAKQIENYLNTVYTGYHGSDEGLEQLKQLAKASPFPKPDFKIETASEIDARKEEEFKAKYPQLALWLGIKRQLSDTNGEQYFETSVKNAAVPKLKGTLMEGKPACRSKELLVAVPEPNQQGVAQVVITLKLVDAAGKADALTGKPDTEVVIQWEGVPSAFTREPFMLTMDTEKAKIEGLKTTPCTPPPAAKKAPPAPKKK
jgi:hypothetical protein